MNFLVENTYKALDFYERGLLSESELLDLIESGIIDAEMLDEGFIDGLKNGVRKVKGAIKKTAIAGGTAALIGSVGASAIYHGKTLHDDMNKTKSEYHQVLSDKSKELSKYGLKLKADKNDLLNHLNKDNKYHNERIEQETKGKANSEEYVNNPENRNRYEKQEIRGRQIDELNDKNEHLKRINKENKQQIWNNHSQKEKDENGVFSMIGNNLKQLGSIGSNAYKQKINNKHIQDIDYKKSTITKTDHEKKLDNEDNYTKSEINKNKFMQQALRDENAKNGGEKFHQTYTSHLANIKTANDAITKSHENIAKNNQHAIDIHNAEQNAKNAEDRYNNSFTGKLHKTYTKAKEIGHGLYKIVTGD